MNDFLRYGSDRKPEAESGSYYVQLSQAELVERENGDTDVVFYFDGFKKEWFDDARDYSDETWVDWFEKSRSFIIEIPDNPIIGTQIDRTGDGKGLPGLDDLQEPDGWLELDLQVLPGGIEGPNQAVIYPNLYAAGARAELKQVNDIDTGTLARLRRYTSSASKFPDANPKIIEQALRVSSIDHLVIYDVGQGSCVGLCDANGVVEMYFDFGQGVLANRGTVPTALSQFCFTKNPPIVLSHWDFDHWSSANMDIRSLTQTWIVPHQMLGASHLAMAARIIASGGTLLFWPKTPPVPPALHVRQVRVEKCTGSGRNHSGLAMSVFETRNPNSDAILLPGDARYSVIPRIAAGGHYLSAVVPHHGGRMTAKAVVGFPAQNHARLVYSTGLPNTFGHAHVSTRSLHQAAGWIDPVLTLTPVPPSQVRHTFDRGKSGLGHVQIGWANPPALTPSPCSGSCSLAPQQT